MQDEVVRILKELPDDTWINMLFFHRTVFTWQKQLRQLKGGARQSAIDYVRNLKTEFQTNIYDTLELALSDKSVDTVYLLSDGQPLGGKYDRPEDILREIGAINRVRGVTIHCIAFGEESRFLGQLAKQNGGEYRFESGR